MNTPRRPISSHEARLNAKVALANQLREAAAAQRRATKQAVEQAAATGHVRVHAGNGTEQLGPEWEAKIGQAARDRWITLSHNQVAVLRPGVIIGRCGAFACAYSDERDDRRVVKFTQDPTDVAAIMALQGQKHAVKLYEAHKLVEEKPESDAVSDVYAVVVERLWPVEDWLGSLLEAYGSQANIDLLPFYDKSEIKNTPRFRYPKEVRESFEFVCYGMGKECVDGAREYVDMMEGMAQRGIRFHDSHAGNFGTDASGVWKVLDIGISRSGLPQVQSLHGLRRYGKGRILR